MRTTTLILFLAAVAATLAGCGGSKSSSGTTAAATTGAAGGGASVLVGAGSTFVYPLESQWAADYSKQAGATITYGPVGSGAGIQSITSRTVDFGASDAPLSPDQMSACKGCVEVPWALGGTAIAYNLKGAPDHLELDGPTLAKIYLGQITSWNDPAIEALNHGVALPQQKITPVYRSDGSGTSFNFVDYLSSITPTFKSTVGVSTQPPFPVGVGAKGSSGVTGLVKRTAGSLTYVDVAYAQQNGLAYAAVENAAGKFILPSVSSIKAAASAATSPKPNAAISIVDPPASAPSAYPISTFTYVIVAKQAAKAAALRKFLGYAITDGQQFGPKLLFAPLPPKVVTADRKAIAQVS